MKQPFYEKLQFQDKIRFGVDLIVLRAHTHTCIFSYSINISSLQGF